MPARRPRRAPGSDQRPAPNLGGWGRTAPLPPATEPRRARLTGERSRGRPARCVKPRRPPRGPDGSGSPRPRAPAPTPAPAPRPGPAPTLSQRPEQVQLQRQERPPSAPPARAQLCRRPPAALPRVPAGALGRRAGSAGPPPPLGAGRGPPRPPRARRAAAAPGHAEEEPPPPAPGLGPRERDGRARPRSRSAPAAPRLPEGPAGAEEEETSPPPPPPPGAEEKVRPPARRRSPSAAAAPHSQPGRTRRPPAPAAAADWPQGGGSRASRPAPTPSLIFKLGAPARLEFRAGPPARLGGFPRRLRPLGTRGAYCRPPLSRQALGGLLGRGLSGPHGWGRGRGRGRRGPRPTWGVRSRRWAGARAAEEQVGQAAEPLAGAGGRAPPGASSPPSSSRPSAPRPCPGIRPLRPQGGCSSG
ncbi:proline-rich protein 2-like [Lontra canadensis]|uniref:proline-rich protein 2-like n=1 Tax=Lontra canadensis TaxID=76717 RepID=UPI0013F2C60C|nr:proline-rich protein 2-like [Lontra canadensis]